MWLAVLCVVAAARTASSADASFSILNWDVNLVNETAANVTARRGQVLAAIANAAEDVLCIQGTWYERDVRDIAAAAAARYPFTHAFFDVASDESRGTNCQPGRAEELNSCFQTHCRTEAELSRNTSDFAPVFNCLLSKCVFSLRDIAPDSCRVCLFQKLLSLGNDSVTACQADTTGLYETTHYLMMLSRKPLRNRMANEFTDGFLRLPRAFLYAEVDTGLKDPAEAGVACTFLTDSRKRSPIGKSACARVCVRLMRHAPTCSRRRHVRRDSRLLVHDFRRGERALLQPASGPLRAERALVSACADHHRQLL
jgi:hypothetical protein